MTRAIDRLSHDPYATPGVKKLVGQIGYRLRVGDHRVLYVLKNDVLLVRVLVIANRRDAYD